MNFATAVLTNVGGRKKNEDYAGYNYKPGQYGAWIVADGLGGHSAGEIASNTAVYSALKLFERDSDFSEKNLENVILSANDMILMEQAADKKNNMCTTIVALFTNTTEAMWAHVGDSRLYRFRNGNLLDQTNDHSVSQMAVYSGKITNDQIRFHEDRNKLLRALGTGRKQQIEVHKPAEPINPGDVYLLCTDGFWEYVYETEMEADLAIAASPDEWLELMTKRLVQRVNGKHDNYTAIAVFAG